MHVREASLPALAALLVLSLSSCVLLPVRVGPGVEGVVVDQTTGDPLAGAIVVVRFDGRYGEVLPDREQLGHAETTTGPDGRFRVDRYVAPGLTVWPHFRTEARVVGVMHEGHRCPPPLSVPPSGRVRIALSAALDPADQRGSCRPVPARRGEADAYMAAWRGLFPTQASDEERERNRQIERLLEARASLGFGQNCEGPVVDLALAPGGLRAAFVATGDQGPEVHLVELRPRGASTPRRVARADNTPPRRLAWTHPDELVLWLPSPKEDRAISPSIFAPGRSEVVWTSSRRLPEAIDRGTPAASRRSSERRPLDPEDLSDEAATLWLGRSFALERSLDPETGLSRDRLRVTREDGTRYEIDLPGEACGPSARYGRPHYRIAARGEIGLDLRFVNGGCHAVQIDLESGDWAHIDRAEAPTTCRAQRRIPPAHLATALRGWTRELHAALEAAGADPEAAHALRISPTGETEVLARDFAGQPLTVSGPHFPLATPLRRIDLTNVAPAVPGSRVVPEPLPAAAKPL